MSAAFVPLIPGAVSSASHSSPTRVKPIAAVPTPFEPASATKLKSETPAQTPAAAPHVPHGPPQITLERQGETITHIRIECSCGQVTELKCEY